MSRKMTNKVIEAIENGTLSYEIVANACLRYMSEDEVADMAHDNGFFEWEDEDGEE